MSKKFRTIVSRIKQEPIRARFALEDLIEEAINTYQKSKGNRRNEDIKHIRAMLKKLEDKPFDVIRNDLIDYLNSPQYKRGYTGNSYLGDCILAALFVYQEIHDKAQETKDSKKAALEKALISLKSRGLISKEFDSNELDELLSQSQEGNFSWAESLVEKPRNISQKNIEIINNTIEKSLKRQDPYAGYSTKTLSYDFNTLVFYAIRQYEDINPNISVIRKENIRAITEILNSDISDKDKKEKIQNYLKENFSLFNRSRLVRFVNKAIDNYSKTSKAQANEETITRTLRLKEWSKDENKEIEGERELDRDEIPKKKVVLAIHGLQDSVDTFNGIARQYVDAGYTVVSYDQYGHGYDEYRNKGSLNLQQMQFDFYKMLEEYLADPNVSELTILGHSLGGAIIANSLKTISELDESSKVKKIQLIAPAAMKNPILQIIGNLPTILFSEGDKTDSVAYASNCGLRRTGGPSPISSLGEFIEFVANAFNSLRTVFSAAVRFSVPIKIYHAEDDGLVDASNIKKLEKANQAGRTNHSVEFFPRGQHHPHAHGSPTSIRLVDKEQEDEKGAPDVDSSLKR